MPYTVVQFTLPLAVGDVYHRVTWPMQALAAQPGFRVIQIQLRHPCSLRLAFDADLLILNMGWDVDLLPILRWRKAKGKPTIFEVNDYIFEAHPANPNLEFWNNPTTQQDCLCLMRLADLVQTSSPFLAKTFQTYNSRVAVFPNQLSRLPERLPSKPERPPVIGWGGSMGHLQDLANIAPAVSKWITEHDDVSLWIMGNEAIAKFFTVPPEKKRHIPWGSMEDYERFLSGVHIGLAPLRDNPYNRGRSDVKWLEYAAHGCVFVGQRIETYAAVEDGKTGFLFDDNAELLRILDRLYQDRALAESVRRAAFDHVSTNRRYETHAPERARIYEELLRREPPSGAGQADLDVLSRFASLKLPDPAPNFLSIPLKDDEQRALADLYSARYDIPEPSIRLVEERFGEYYLTEYARAVIAFARRDAAEAERRLRRSLSFYPAALRSLSFLGQLLIGQRRFQEARETLAVSVRWSPEQPSAYPHLVAAAEALSDWPAALDAADQWEERRNDPRARLRKGLVLLRAGRVQEGIGTLSEAVAHLRDSLRYWQTPFAADVASTLRQAEPLASKDSRWSDLILKAAEMYPYGLWLASRAGMICFERGEYERGARILQQARERLLAWEWQTREGLAAPQEYRRLIESYRMACEDLANPLRQLNDSLASRKESCDVRSDDESHRL